MATLAQQVSARLVAELDDPASSTRKFVRKVVAIEVGGELAAIRQDLHNAVLAVEQAAAKRGERMMRLEQLQVAMGDTMGRFDAALGQQADVLQRIEATLADGRSGVAWLAKVGKAALIVIGGAGVVIAALTSAVAWLWSLFGNAPPPAGH